MRPTVDVVGAVVVVVVIARGGGVVDAPRALGQRVVTAAGMESCPHPRRCSPRVQMLGGGGVPASSQFLTIQKGGTSGNAPGRQHAHRQGRRQAADCQSDEAPAAGWLVTRRAAGRHQIGPRAPQPAQRTGRGARGEPATSYVGDTTTSRDPKTAHRPLYAPVAVLSPVEGLYPPPRPSKGLVGPHRAQYGSIRSTEHQCGV